MKIQTLIPYGCAEACETARRLIENSPDVIRLDLTGPIFRILSAKGIPEMVVLRLLEASDLDGFELR